MSFYNDQTALRRINALEERLRRLMRTLDAQRTAIAEGATDVVVGGVAVAKVGHDGGSAGLLVPDGSGGWRTVQVDAQARADAALAAAEAQITTLSGRVSTAEGSISSLQGTASNHAGRIATLEGQTSGIGSIESRLTAVETGLSQHNVTLQNLHNRVTALENTGV